MAEPPVIVRRTPSKVIQGTAEAERKMAQPKILEGTWDELAAHAEELRAYPKLTLIISPAEPSTQSRYRADLTPEERIRALDAIAERNRGLPVLPEEAFDRENLYADDEEER